MKRAIEEFSMDSNKTTKQVSASDVQNGSSQFGQLKKTRAMSMSFDYSDSNKKQIQISVKTMTGNVLDVLAYNDDTVSELKYQIQDAHEIAADSQALIYNGTVLENEKKLVDYGIETDCTINLALHMGSGPGLPLRTKPKAKESSVVVLVCKRRDDVFFMEVSKMEEKFSDSPISAFFNENKSQEIPIASKSPINTEIGNIDEVKLLAKAPLDAATQKTCNRCSACNRKLGLATKFTCRCGQQFCGEHRYSDKHDCSFDFRSVGRDIIREENPVVQKDKIERI